VLRFLFSLLVLFTFFGCGHLQVNITSTKDSAYHQKIDRLLIFVDSAMCRRIYSDEEKISKIFVEKLKSQGVSAEALEEDPLELDSNGVKRNATAKFKPTHIMTLNCTHYSSKAGLTFVSSIYDPKTGKRIWRADILSASSWDKVVEKMIEQLQVDDLLNKTEQK
jgi:hypothetical protein